MSEPWSRRDVLRLMSVGGVVFASGLAGCEPRAGAQGPAAPAPPLLRDFVFLQLSDTHWGFKGPPNPEADRTLKETVALINAAERQPDFIVFTGDLTHTTDDPRERRARMAQFKEIVAELRVRDVHFLPGEHDASLDAGEAYRDAFGPPTYAFDHQGVHFVALDNVSSAAAELGEAQLDWLEKDLSRLPPEMPVVVLAHRPLFDLAPSWEWSTRDGARAQQILARRRNVTVFYGHIHQEHHHVELGIAHHAARSLVFPLPAPLSAPKKAPLPWDPASPDHGLGHVAITTSGGISTPRIVPFRPG